MGYWIMVPSDDLSALVTGLNKPWGGDSVKWEEGYATCGTDRAVARCFELDAKIFVWNFLMEKELGRMSLLDKQFRLFSWVVMEECII